MIQAITREEILNGLGQDYYCCMFGISKHTYRCDMWREIFDQVGGIGFLARDKEKVIGQMIFLPKKYARKIALPTSPNNKDIDTTMVIGCLYVLKEYSNQGIASEMISALINFCREHGYGRVEACIDPRPPQEVGINTSFYPFRKFGFVIDNSREGWEFKPQTEICCLSLKDEG